MPLAPFFARRIKQFPHGSHLVSHALRVSGDSIQLCIHSSIFRVFQQVGSGPGAEGVMSLHSPATWPVTEISFFAGAGAAMHIENRREPRVDAWFMACILASGYW